MATPRREFPKLALLASGASLLARDAWAAEVAPVAGRLPPKKVLIVGAGLAGLVAAHELTLRYVRRAA